MTKPAQIIKPPGKFHGGIHPPEYKTISSETPIAHIPTGPELVIPTQQSIGTDSIPTVSAGDQVTRGQLIARCPEGLGANIHSPESGVISSLIIRNKVVFPVPFKPISPIFSFGLICSCADSNRTLSPIK